MASSTSLAIVNKVLHTTGDYSELTSLLNSPAGIASRVVDFINLVIADIEQVTTWPELREDLVFTGDGIASSFEYIGASDIPASTVSSAYTVGGVLLEELTDQQFARVQAIGGGGSTPRYFQRGYNTSTNKFTIKVYPVPANGVSINVTAYKRATRFVVTDNTTTTEFDDQILVAGALMHLDAYDGQDRGYSKIYGRLQEIAVRDNTRQTLRVPLAEYYKWAKRVPDAWKDPVFRESYQKEHAEYFSQV